jgi:hypothetical protein
MSAYTALKQAMTAAGILVSEGEELLHTDLQKARDFLYFQGINIGEEFHRFEEYLAGEFSPAVAPADVTTSAVVVTAPTEDSTVTVNAVTDVPSVDAPVADTTLTPVEDTAPVAETPVTTTTDAPVEAPAADTTVTPAADTTVTPAATATTGA